MPIIEKINQMQKLGINNEEIVKRLQDEGISPKEISEALDQSKVKAAVESNEELQPSVMNSPSQSEFVPIPYNSQSQMQQYQPTEISAPGQTPMQEMPVVGGQMTEGQMPQEYAYSYPQQQYQEYEYTRADTETMTEIAEQVVSEKLQKIEKQNSEIIAFKTETAGKISNVDERLRRIEILIDRLQNSVLGKIGEYGRNISDLKEEMITTQDSFSKILNPLTENIEELKKITHDHSSQRQSVKKREDTAKAKHGKSKNGFEHYLRE